MGQILLWSLDVVVVRHRQHLLQMTSSPYTTGPIFLKLHIVTAIESASQIWLIRHSCPFTHQLWIPIISVRCLADWNLFTVTGNSKTARLYLTIPLYEVEMTKLGANLIKLESSKTTKLKKKQKDITLNAGDWTHDLRFNSWHLIRNYLILLCHI